MTVIAWDGKTLCADKRGVTSDMPITVTKIFRVPQGIVGFDGDYSTAMSLLRWLRDGGNPSHYLYDQQKDDKRWCYALLITPEKKIMRFGYEPNPYEVEDTFYAVGSGRDFAMAALYLGKSAREAVEIACRFDVGCGNGVDELSP